MKETRGSRRRCPQCGWAIVRIPRRPEDRVASPTALVRRYRCCDPGGCGWEGTLVADWADTAVERRRARELARAIIAKSRFVLYAAVGLVTIAIGADGVNGTFGPALHVENARTVPFGVSDFGRPLPENHPFLQQDVDAPVRTLKTAAASTASPVPATSGDGPLSLREDCAWGEPGRSPYRGTVHQALVAARLPGDVIALLEHKIRDHEASDRLEIRNDKIRGVNTEAAFDAQAFRMTFAKTLCLNSRVNFRPGHVERADLYEVTDANGITYSVMIPDVCGNVSVLAPRVTGDETPQDVMASPIAHSRTGDGRGLPSRLPDASSVPPGVPGVPLSVPSGPLSVPIGTLGVPSGPPDMPSGPPDVPMPVPFTVPPDRNSVPEPESWTLVLGSLALLGWFTRGRQRRSRQ